MNTKPELLRQPKRCDACGDPPRADFPKLFVHAHADGTLRGWLCLPCFSIVEAADDDPARLRKMYDWIMEERRGDDA